jgi:ATP-dependent DNA helicase RecG
MYDFIKKKLDEGRQVYFVAPLIEESESLNVKSAKELYDDLKENIFRNYKLALLHGRMRNTEKEEIMHKFKKGEIDILVSTTVIEVGVNVPNASVMCIVDAQRFGLSALHQLRGRVGRGEHKSYCFLVAYTNNDISVSRLRILEKTTDGFEIAEEDLRLRKAGEIFGTKQSGLSDLKFVDVVHDIKTIKLVREIAMEYLKKNKGKIDNIYLKKDIEEKFGV